MLSLVSQGPARGTASLQKTLTVRWGSSRSHRPRAKIRRLSARSPQRYICCPLFSAAADSPPLPSPVTCGNPCHYSLTPHARDARPWPLSTHHEHRLFHGAAPAPPSGHEHERFQCRRPKQAKRTTAPLQKQTTRTNILVQSPMHPDQQLRTGKHTDEGIAIVEIPPQTALIIIPAKVECCAWLKACGRVAGPSKFCTLGGANQTREKEDVRGSCRD